MTRLYLTLRTHRFASTAVVLACLLLTLAAVAVAMWLQSLASPARCLDPDLRGLPECASADQFYLVNEEWGGKIMAFMALLPLLTGIILGVPLVAEEIESGSAVTAWWVSLSRRRWLIVRIAILGTLLAVALTLPAVAADLLERARQPHLDMSTATLVDYGLRGPLVVVRGIAIFMIGVTTGLIIGRVIPAILVGLLVTGLAYGVSSAVQRVGLPEPELFVPRPDASYIDYSFSAGTQYQNLYVDRNGRRVTYGEIVRDAPVGEGDPGFPNWLQENYSHLTFGIPGESLGFIETRELAGYAVTGIGALAIALWRIDRRRPY